MAKDHNAIGWPLSKNLLIAILHDQVTDRFVAELIWERLGYKRSESSSESWIAGANTPANWSQSFPKAPEVIAERQASVKLTRSIPKEYKQLLKKKLNFPGYRISELYPRRTRRATAVNWLLAWLEEHHEDLPDSAPLPQFSTPPQDPKNGHFGDPPIC